MSEPEETSSEPFGNLVCKTQAGQRDLNADTIHAKLGSVVGWSVNNETLSVVPKLKASSVGMARRVDPIEQKLY